MFCQLFFFLFCQLKPHSGCWKEPNMSPGSSFAGKSLNNWSIIIPFSNFIFIFTLQGGIYCWRCSDQSSFIILISSCSSRSGFRSIGVTATNGSLHDCPLLINSLHFTWCLVLQAPLNSFSSAHFHMSVSLSPSCQESALQLGFCFVLFYTES